MPTPREQEQFLDEIIGTIIESGADAEDNDPGYPDLFIADDLPETAIAVYATANEDRPLPYIAIETEAVDRAMFSGKTLELVDSIIHERRHFKQDIKGLRDGEFLTPPASAHAMLLVEVDAYVYTASCLYRLSKSNKWGWLTAGEEVTEASSQGAVNFQEYVAMASGEETEISPEQCLARKLLYETSGFFPLDQLFLDLEHKLVVLQEAEAISSQSGGVGVWSNHWISRMARGEIDHLTVNPYHIETGYFADNNGGHDWLFADDFFAGVLGDECYPVFQNIMCSINEHFERIRHAIRIRPEAFEI